MQIMGLRKGYCDSLENIRHFKDKKTREKLINPSP
jgi:hypothetical protein